MKQTGNENIQIYRLEGVILICITKVIHIEMCGWISNQILGVEGFK